MSTEQPSVEAQNGDKVREALAQLPGSQLQADALAAVAALERAERDRAQVTIWQKEAEARAQKAEAERDIMFKGDWAALNLKLQKAEAVVEAARRLLRDADENASPEIGEFPLDAWLNLVDAVRAYDEPPTEQATDFDWKQQEC
jgi:hypothetical protein